MRQFENVIRDRALVGEVRPWRCLPRKVRIFVIGMAGQDRKLPIGLEVFDQHCKRSVEQPAAGLPGQPRSHLKAFTIDGGRDPHT